MGHNSLILNRILHFVSEKYDTLYKFACTSRLTFSLVGLGIVCSFKRHWITYADTDTQDLWDMNGGSFQHCELPLTGPHAPDRHASVASIVVVTPVRSPAERPGYAGQVRNLCNMCEFIPSP